MRIDEIYFLEVEHVEQAHVDGIALAGGDPSMRDRGLVTSAVMAPRSGYFGSLAEIAAAYAHGIAKNHGFVDGNKRAAVLAMALFLEMNGFAVNPGPTWVTIMEGVADGSISKDALVVDVVKLVGCDVQIEP